MKSNARSHPLECRRAGGDLRDGEPGGLELLLVVHDLAGDLDVGPHDALRQRQQLLALLLVVRL